MSPIRACAEQGCAEPATYRGRCAEHNNRRLADRRGAGAVYWTKRWKILRRHKLTEDSTCERCGDRLATQVHHRRALRAGGAPYEMENLEALCAPCHSRLTRGERP